MLNGYQVKAVSSGALDHWNHLLLVEDDTSRALRRGKPGVADRSNEVLLRLHRIGRSGLKIAEERTHVVGRSTHADKSAAALEMLDSRTCREAVVVAGTTYGCSRHFLAGVVEKGLDAVVEIRPSSLVSRRWDDDRDDRVPVSTLIDGANWAEYAIPVPGAEEQTIVYSIARLGAGYFNSLRGLFFAVQTGGIDGVHPGTIFGFAIAEGPTSRALVEAVGWPRWIRPLVRRAERALVEEWSAAAANGNGHNAEGGSLRLRANIKLAKLHDQERANGVAAVPVQTGLRGLLVPDDGVVNVVELFAGAGGMGLGFLLAGAAVHGTSDHSYRILHSAEVDPIYVNTLNQNHAAARGIFGLDGSLPEEKIEPTDLRDPAALRIAQAAAAEGGGAHVLIGGPPCQGFSNSNRNSWNSENPNNRLVDVYLKYVRTLNPLVFVLENVQGISWTGEMSHPTSSVLEHVRERTQAAGYEVFVRLLDSVWYGVPQYRSRFFVVGLHRDLGYCPDDFGDWGPFPLPTHGPGTGSRYVTVADAISDLPAVGNGECGDAAYSEPDRAMIDANEYLGYLRDGAESGVVTDHVTSRHADYVIERYRQIPSGGNWESIRHLLTNYADVERTHSNIYRRLVWGDPAVTIGHYRKSMLVHPDQHRGLSLREAARLQSFPDWFRFAGSFNGGGGGLMHKQQQLANAVSPLVARAMAEFLLRL
jgi:DNA-cytosine methyltransferase